MPTTKLIRKRALLASALALAWAAAPAVRAEATSSQPPASVSPAEQARPNILVWMMDDVGFAQIGCYGGLVETPNTDAVAHRGLRYTNYHATPVCSASRAAFLTGRNPHAVHVGGHTVLAAPFPGYDGKIPASAGTLAANLQAQGYLTYALGKWDHLPSMDMSEAGPFTYWPSGQGFDRFYGFLAAETDQTRPMLWSDHAPVPTPSDPSYGLTADLADHAIEMIRSRTVTAVRSPFFMYWATGAAHAPHQAPAEYLQKYRGRFDDGWDKARSRILQRQIAMGIVPKGTTLAPRPAGMPAWDSLSPDQKRSYARGMEAFAAYLDYADAQFGRILATLEAQGELDNTIIVITSDNGASAEGAFDGTHNETVFATRPHPGVAENLKFYDVWGTAATYAHYPLGWAVAGNTPLRYYKQTTYEGGIRVPLVVAWNRGIKGRGQLRGQFEDIIDVTPTLLEAAGLQPAPMIGGTPQSPFDGRSLVATFDDPKAPEIKRAQYFEMFGNAGVWKDGWKAVLPHKLEPWDMSRQPPFTQTWELYDLRHDLSETHDLAAKEPARLAELKAAFDEEGRKNNVFPLMNSAAGLAEFQKKARLDFERRKGVWDYPGPIVAAPSALSPPALTRSYVMTAAIDVASPTASGPIFALGGRYGGVALYLKDGRPTFAYRDPDATLTRVTAEAPIAPGAHEIRLVFDHEKDGARVEILDGGTRLADARIDRPIAQNVAVNEVLSIAIDQASPVSDDYSGAPTFQGRVGRVTFDFNPRARTAP